MLEKIEIAEVTSLEIIDFLEKRKAYEKKFRKKVKIGLGYKFSFGGFDDEAHYLIIEIDTQKCLIKTIDLSRNNSTSSEWKTLSNYNLKHLVSDQKEFAYSKRYKNYLKKELC